VVKLVLDTCDQWQSALAQGVYGLFTVDGFILLMAAVRVATVTSFGSVRKSYMIHSNGFNYSYGKHH
jgi:hypothetical protein